MKEVDVEWIENDQAMVDGEGQAYTPLDWNDDIENILSILESELLPHGLELVVGKTDDAIMWFRVSKVQPT